MGNQGLADSATISDQKYQYKRMVSRRQPRVSHIRYHQTSKNSELPERRGDSIVCGVYPRLWDFCPTL
jgi:hypothetical protein